MVLDPHARPGDELDPELEQFLEAYLQGLDSDSRMIDDEEVHCVLSDFNSMRVCAGMLQAYYEGQIMPVGIEHGSIVWRKAKG